MTIDIEYVDYGVQGEYGFFGKVVARTTGVDCCEEEIAHEIDQMKAMMGDHIVGRIVETIPAAS